MQNGSNESITDEIVNGLERHYKKAEEIKVKNKEIKERLLAEIDEIINHYENIKDSKNYNNEIAERYERLVQSNNNHIKFIIAQSKALKSILQSIDENSYEDYSFLEPLSFVFEALKHPYDKDTIIFFPEELFSIGATVLGAIKFVSEYKEQKKIYENLFTKDINDMFQEAKSELYDFREYKNILKNIRTQDYYDTAKEEFLKKSKKYRNTFLVILILALMIAMVSVLAEPRFFLDKFDYWFLKISSILVSITIITYFLKQSIHYQKFADQANQTGLEIRAFPTFIAGADKETESEIRKQLALKYFGREIDGAAHKDMSNLISDQMKSTTDMVKATTEAIKNLKGS